MDFNGLKVKIKSLWNNANFSDWSLKFLLQENRVFLLILSLSLFGYCVYLWYGYIYDPAWNEIKKQEYIESRQEENVVFNRKKFDKVITELENRKNNFQKSAENIPDIFSLE